MVCHEWEGIRVSLDRMEADVKRHAKTIAELRREERNLRARIRRAKGTLS